MNLLLWNCRGLGNPRTENEFVRLIQTKDHSIVFIVETWANEIRLNRTLSKINFDQKWVVPRLNKGGGLAYFGKILLTLMLLIPTGIILIRLLMETLKMHGDSQVFMVSPKPIRGVKHGVN